MMDRYKYIAVVFILFLGGCGNSLSNESGLKGKIVYEEGRDDDLMYWFDLADEEAVNFLGEGSCPDISPDGTMVAFSKGDEEGDSEIYVMGIQGDEIRHLTDNDFEEGCPKWAPDGRSLAFSREQDENWDIWVLEVESMLERQITFHPAADVDPSWSPDGERFVFVSSRDEGGSYARCEIRELYVVSMSGKELLRLTNSPFCKRRPRWLLDGQHIVFESNQDQIWHEEQKIFILDLENGEIRRLIDMEDESYPLPEFFYICVLHLSNEFRIRFRIKIRKLSGN